MRRGCGAKASASPPKRLCLRVDSVRSSVNLGHQFSFTILAQFMQLAGE
jgi:hypothetical protein